jgi:hypothetical protein
MHGVFMRLMSCCREISYAGMSGLHLLFVQMHHYQTAFWINLCKTNTYCLCSIIQFSPRSAFSGVNASLSPVPCLWRWVCSSLMPAHEVFSSDSRCPALWFWGAADSERTLKGWSWGGPVVFITTSITWLPTMSHLSWILAWFLHYLSAQRDREIIVLSGFLWRSVLKWPWLSFYKCGHHCVTPWSVSPVFVLVSTPLQVSAIIPCVFMPVFSVCLLPVRLVRFYKRAFPSSWFSSSVSYFFPVLTILPPLAPFLPVVLYLITNLCLFSTCPLPVLCL